MFGTSYQITRTKSDKEIPVDYSDGFLNLQNQNLDLKDMNRIFLKLSCDRSRPPRKCRRLDGTERVIAGLSSASCIRKMDLSFNYLRGANQWHVLPNTIRFLDLSNCSLHSKEIAAVCNYVEANTSVICLKLNENCPELCGSKAIGRMLANNKTLEELHLASIGYLWHLGGRDGHRHIANGLLENNTLRVLDTSSSRSIRIEFVLYFASSLLNGGGSALERLFLQKARMKDGPFCKTVSRKWEVILEKRERLRSLGWFEDNNNFGNYTWDGVRFWLKLNNLNARKVIRDGSMHEFVYTLERASMTNDAGSVLFYMLLNIGRYLK